ncbi:MAG: hypothetical protein NTY19_25610 [Planctomycetota bacterium]|nr:hypothetical protein [Planctomycetota bacterium]
MRSNLTTTRLIFQALPADRPGFVRVSRADPHYFAFDNGQG